MRRWIDIFTQPPIPSTERSSILREFASDNSRQLSHVEQALTDKLGVLQRIGGPKRLYDVGRTGQRAALYVIANSVKGIGLAWKDPSSGVSTLYLWNTLNPFNDPDFEIDLPPTGDFDIMLPKIISMLKTQHQGLVPISIAESVFIDEAKNPVSEFDFFQMAQKMFGKRAANLSWADIQSVATKNNVQVPPGIRNASGLKTSPTTWNLSGATQDTKGLAQAAGSSLEDPEPVPGFQSMLQLAKAKEVNRLVGTGQIFILGRKPSGAFFSVPGVAAYSAQMERMLASELSDGENGEPSMEEQYKLLADKVELIASGKSHYIKSLLVTGAPASGKSYNVIRTIEKLGMKEGKDYIVSTGMLTRPELYRLLIEQVNGMIILDDSDGIVQDADAMNMLKGALDTKPVREISYRVRGTINTAILPADEREEYAERLSRVLRDVADSSDAAYFARFAHVKSARNTMPKSAPTDDEDDGFDDLSVGFSDEAQPDPVADSESAEIFKYVTTHLPNKIDFKGRMIFISNMERDEWPDAIISRADTVNMSFSDEEMLNFFDKIKDSFDAALTSTQKTEVLDYLRQLWTMGKLNRTINFRLLQLCFDYRLVSGWRKLMAAL
jgi:hypothetical protein